jgi:cytoskeletal protein CcmA (bactofilin family)
MLRNNPGERFERPNEDLSRDPLAPTTTRPIRDPAAPVVDSTNRGNLSAGLRSDRGASVIDATSSFDGHYEAGDDLVILGTASGEVICRGKLTVEKEANVTAKIQSHEAHILGRLEGDIVCSGRLLISSSATVTGTVKAAALVVEEGATIRGTVETASVASSDVLASVTRSASRRASGDSEAAVAAAASASSSGRWNRSREAPNFAVVASEEREESTN